MPGGHRLESEGKKEQICHHWEGYETHSSFGLQMPIQTSFWLHFFLTLYIPEQY